jgi:hypothetical protein
VGAGCARSSRAPHRRGPAPLRVRHITSTLTIKFLARKFCRRGRGSWMCTLPKATNWSPRWNGSEDMARAEMRQHAGADGGGSGPACLCRSAGGRQPRDARGPGWCGAAALGALRARALRACASLHPTLPPSLFPSLSPSLPLSLSPSLPLSLSPSLPLSLSPSPSPPLLLSPLLSLSPLFLSLSLSPSLPFSLPVALLPGGIAVPNVHVFRRRSGPFLRACSRIVRPQPTARGLPQRTTRRWWWRR